MDRLEAFHALVRSPSLITRSQFRSKGCPVPKSDGIYAWFFNDVIPGLDTSRCHRVGDLVMLYVGIAREADSDTPEKRHLHDRMRDHFCKNAAASTLRLSLGSMLMSHLGIELRKVGGMRPKFDKKTGLPKINKRTGEQELTDPRLIFANGGERRLDEWMDENAFVTWLPMHAPWEVEPSILQTGPYYLPINIQDHCGRGSPVSLAREAARAHARGLDRIAKDSGR